MLTGDDWDVLEGIAVVLEVRLSVNNLNSTYNMLF